MWDITFVCYMISSEWVEFCTSRGCSTTTYVNKQKKKKEFEIRRQYAFT